MEKNQENKNQTRSVWIEDEIFEEQAYKIIREIITLDMADNTRPIRIFIDSRGGTIKYVLNIKEILLHSISSPLITIGLFHIYSAASFIMACGHVRVIIPQTEFLFHKTTTCINGSDVVQVTEEDLKAQEIVLKKGTDLALRQSTIRRREHTNPCRLKPAKLLKLIDSSPDKDFFVNSKMAITFGFADRIIKKVSEIDGIERELMKTFGKNTKR